MFIRSNNRTHPHFHTTDDISSLILRAPAGRYCTSLLRSKRIRDRVRYFFDTPLETWWRIPIFKLAALKYLVYSFFRISFVYLFFSLVSTYSFPSSFPYAFFCTFVSLFYSYCSSFFCFFLYSRIIVYRSIMCQINRKMKFNARIDKLNVNLY